MFSRVRDAAFFVRSVGVGDPPLVTTGALSAGSEFWCDVTDRFAATRRVVSIDQRGAGRTQGSSSGMTLATQTEDLLAVLVDLGIERCVHITESAGCAPALAAAAQRPELFAGLVLTAPAHWWLDPPDQRDAQPAEQTIPTQDEQHAILEQFASSSLSDTRDPVLVRWARELLGDDWDSLVDADRVSQTNDLRAVVPEVTTPTLIIHGDGDVITSVDGSKRLLSSLPNGELAILDGVGHAPMITAPDRVAAAITTFLTRIEI